jgi:cell division protein FtsI/penicillin-binding protein 2
MSLGNRHSSDWRSFQGRLQREARRRRTLKRLPLIALFVGGLAFMAALIHVAVPRVAVRLAQHPAETTGPAERSDLFRGPVQEPGPAFDLAELRLGETRIAPRFVVERKGARYTVLSSLDPSLQAYIQRLLRYSQTHRAAVVVMRPSDGRILAMVSHAKEEAERNLCTADIYPAASLFKIVSAAAAMERAGYTPDRAVYFVGRRHTLYKKQLRQERSRYSEKTSFRRAFASSINSVFGKMGIYDLGEEILGEYAERFFFNRAIPFDVAVEKSRIQVPNDDFGLAELSSGFNKQTRISPLHAAMLSAVPANNGIMMVPHFVDQVRGESGEILYRSGPRMLSRPVSLGTAKGLRVLMEDTVRYGTCRSTFSGLLRKRSFKNVDLGAKTGNVNDESDRYKFDWLTAYVIPRSDTRAICLAVLAVHGEKLGVRANLIGRQIIQHYLTS